MDDLRVKWLVVDDINKRKPKAMEKRDVLVSIFCITYNHEQFIRQALESFVVQKTNFDYEVIVHDDASTDNTAGIIREFEEKYPNVIKPIYQEVNQYTKGGGVTKYLLPKAQGKYIAFCEGDDFWTDSRKLQMQTEALEANEECAICFNKVELADVESRRRGIMLPMINRVGKGVIKSTDFLAFVAFPGEFQCMSYQLSGCMVRRKYLIEYYEEEPLFKRVFDVGDLPLFLYMGTKGDAYYIDCCMSCYRTGNLNSWAGRIRESVDKEVEHYERESNGFREFDCYSNFTIHDSIEKGIKNREFICLRCRHDVANMKRGEMRELYYRLPLKSRVAQHIFYFFPRSESIWIKIKSSRCIQGWRDKKAKALQKRQKSG